VSLAEKRGVRGAKVVIYAWTEMSVVVKIDLLDAS
jgi:hypothetical protein